MAEQNTENQHFYVAGRGGSERKVEVRIHHRPFTQIQSELKGLVNNPNPSKERELVSERAKLLREAKDVGVFGRIKSDFASIQEGYNFGSAHTKIREYDVGRKEDQLKDTLEGWRPEFEGMLLEYRYIARKNMELAYERAKGRGTGSHARNLEREIEVRGWGMPPTFLEAKANEYIDSQIVVQRPVEQTQRAPQPDQQTRTAHETAVEDTLESIKSLIEAQAQASPQNQLDPAEFAKAFAEAMGKVPPERQLELVREAEGAMLPVEISPTSPPDFFAHVSKEEQEAWMARSTLVVAAAKKKAAIKLEMLHPNDEGMGFTKEELKTLWEHKTGSFHATALYTHMIANNLNVSDVLGNVGPDLDFNKIFEIDDDPSFEALRKKMRKWLEVKMGLNEIQAQDAEQIAWNIVYTTGLLEDKDTRNNPKITDTSQGRNKGTVASLKNVATWVLMHPQERLEAKAKTDNPGANLSSREAWGAFGNWAVNMANKGKRIPRILPERLIGNGLSEIELKIRQSSGGVVETNMEEYLVKRAQQILAYANRPNANANAMKATNTQVINEIDWNNMGNAPFYTHFADRISPAVKIASVIAEGGRV